MDIRTVGLPDRIVDLLVGAGLETVEAVWGAGDLTAISGIGDKSAASILETLPPAEEPIPVLSPTRWVVVRNNGNGPVIVNGTYLHPGEARKVRAAHAPAGLTIKEISDGN